jgi:hypothetical protein
MASSLGPETSSTPVPHFSRGKGETIVRSKDFKFKLKTADGGGSFTGLAAV